MKIECAHDALVDIDLLVPNPQNANVHSDQQIKLLAKIMDHQGVRHPITVSNQSGFINTGHGRLMAAKYNGWTQMPVDYQDFATPADEYASMIADNKIAELAETDMLKVNADAMLLGPDFDLELLGIPDFEIIPTEELEPGCDEDAVPEFAEPKSKLGQIYRLGSHRLMCGDSTDISFVERLINKEKIEMVFTDPPYGIKEEGDRSSRSGITQGNNLKSFVDDSVQYAIDAFSLCQALEIPLQVWWGANYYCHSLPQQNNWLVWDKRVEEQMKDNNSDCELAWVQNGRQSVRIFRHLWKGLIKGSEHNSKRVHPTQKPIALAEWSFERYGDPKTVLDLFGGSGSTLIACEKTNRKCFMMELDPHYVDVIIARWEKYTGKKAELLNG